VCGCACECVGVGVGVGEGVGVKLRISVGACVEIDICTLLCTMCVHFSFCLYNFSMSVIAS